MHLAVALGVKTCKLGVTNPFLYSSCIPGDQVMLDRAADGFNDMLSFHLSIFIRSALFGHIKSNPFQPFPY
jgi:hypothetical protein